MTLKTGTSDVLNVVVVEMKLKRVPKLLIGAENAVPMVWGVWRPRLLLPEGFAKWPTEKLRGVLLHELAHLKRGDPLALWTAQWVKALHWFNPLAWLTIQQLRADQERACDDTVLRHGVRASDYAQHLLDLSRHTRVAPGLALCALTMTRCSPVESRVKAILDVRRSREGLTRRWLLGLAGVALLATVPVAMLHAIEGTKLRGRILDRNGVVLAESTAEKVRTYPLPTLTAHVVGYTGKSGPKDATPAGRAAMEKMQDGVLRQGKDVALTLDARVQKLTTQAMQDGGIQRGAAVVMDPRTGEILAAVSLPSYDANWFVPLLSQERWDGLIKDTSLPMMDRCFTGEYPPGAAFTPFTALAGLSAGVGNPTYVCNGSVTYGERNFQCWKWVRDQTGHGALDMTGALVGSCNCYWYQFGNAAGLTAFDKLAPSVGLGERYGLNERAGEGEVPKFAFIQGQNRKATGGDLANISIGQGRVLMTPLQLAVLASTVANGGKVPQPKLVRDELPTQWRTDLTSSANVSAVEVEKIREGMRQVVNGDAGTGKTAKSERVVIAAKTGTAQWRISKDQNLAVMIGFAPYDKPRLAFAILHEGATGEAVSGGKNCGPVAKRIVEETLSLPVDGSGAVLPMMDAVNGASEKAEQAETQKKQLIEKLRALRKERPLNQAVYDATLKEIVALMNQVMPAPAPAKFVPASSKPPAEMERWKEMQKSGGLAELPPETLVEMLTRRDALDAGAVLSSYFRFTAPREKAHAWLMASLSEKWRQKQAKMLSWPKAPETFYRAYFVTDRCHIVVRSEDGKVVSVAVEKRKLPILIAPDEATPPRPKTAAPRELEGVVSADASWRSPWAASAFEMNLEVHETTPRGDELNEALETQRHHKGVDMTLLVGR